jgi:hypothetical protein
MLGLDLEADEVEGSAVTRTLRIEFDRELACDASFRSGFTIALPLRWN